MKKLVFIIFFLFSLTAKTYSQEDLKRFFISANVSYFHPWDLERFEDIGYEKKLMWGGEISFRFYKRLAVWVSASYYNDWGRDTCFEDDIWIRFVPIGFGLKYLHPLNEAALCYIAAGASFYLLRIREKIKMIDRTTVKKFIGPTARIGFLLRLNENTFFDIFLNFSYKRFKTEKFIGKDVLGEEGIIWKGRKYNVGGINFGVAFGIMF